MDQGYINHIALVLDASGSIAIADLEDAIISVADSEIAYLAQRSRELDQETRATVYTFNTHVECVYYDKDVLRLMSLQGKYTPNGQTALIDATLRAMRELSQTAQLYGDHAFLVYVLTDGMENASKAKPAELQRYIAGLSDNWTVAVLVPNNQAVFEAKKFGFPAGNIAVWDAQSQRGVSEAGQTIRNATAAYLTNRSAGIRGTKSIFIADVSRVDTSQLQELHPLDFRIVPVYESDVNIATFVLGLGGSYTAGSTYYQLTKPEDIQEYKVILLRDRLTDKVYTGPNVRAFLGLPTMGTVRVHPGTHTRYEIYVQSTSYNRKLVRDTRVLIMNAKDK